MRRGEAVFGSFRTTESDPSIVAGTHSQLNLESNWLPAPAGKFILMLRMYWPNEKEPSIINGTWSPPAVRKVASS
ncbi:DUF1214 domain-containing protein [Bradyrhizobium sp. UFLA05-109]